MDVVRESEGSLEGDDDKVYMFFSENAVEYDFPNKLMVSRVARVCKVTYSCSYTHIQYDKYCSDLLLRLQLPEGEFIFIADCGTTSSPPLEAGV